MLWILFWNVEYNLLALYGATRHPVMTPSKLKENEKCYENLMPNLTCVNGNRNLNFSSGGILPAILHCPLYKNETLARIKDALKYTHDLFHRYQEQLMQVHLHDHELFLIQKINHQPVDKKSCKKTQEKIQEFYYSTQYIFKELKGGKNDRLATIFKDHFCKHCFDHIDLLEENYAIIALHSVSNDEIPLKTLIDYSYGSTKEKNGLKSFVNALPPNNTNIRMLHSALMGIIAHAKRFHQTKAHVYLNQIPDLAILESHLYDQNHQIFTQIDPDHLAWRQSLQEGSTLTSEFYDDDAGKMSCYIIVLGKQLGKKDNPNDLDHNLYFEIKTLSKNGEEPLNISNEWVFWTTINSALPGIKWKQAEKCIIKPAAFHFIDNQGRFALVDRLVPLPCGTLETNATFYNSISGFLGWLAYQGKITLDNLNVENYMLAKHPEETHRWVITSIKLTYPLDKFSFTKLEQFAYDISKGNNAIYQYILQKSALSQTDEAEFIKKAALATFQDKFDHEKEALKKKFKDKSVKEFANTLQLEIEKMRDNCMRNLKMKHKAPSIKDLENAILQKYSEKGCISLLWPTLEQEVIEQFSI